MIYYAYRLREKLSMFALIHHQNATCGVRPFNEMAIKSGGGFGFGARLAYFLVEWYP